jgi:hypothetical protein
MANALDVLTSATLLQRLHGPDKEAAWRTFVQRYGPLPAGEVAGSLGMKVGAVYQAKSRVSQLLREEGARQRETTEAPGGAP